MMAQLDYVEDPFARNVDWLLMDLSFIIYVYYLPNNLFKAAPGIAKPHTENQERATGTKLHFARIVQKCELYKARQAALGIESKGRQKNNNKKTKEDKDDSSSSSSEESIESRNTNNKRRKSQQRNNKNNNKKRKSQPRNNKKKKNEQAKRRTQIKSNKKRKGEQNNEEKKNMPREIKN